MSINNSYRLAAYSESYVHNRAEANQHKTRVVTAVRNEKFTLNDSSAKQAQVDYSSSIDVDSLFDNSAQELFYSVSDSSSYAHRAFRESYVNSASSKYSHSQIDVKRHQGYFNQMMNFNNPSGSWVDTFN